MKRPLVAVLMLAALFVGIGERPVAATTWSAVCPPPQPGYARCLAEVTTSAGIEGITPNQLKTAYGFPTAPLAGKAQTVYVVSAFDAPFVESDLNVFSAEFGLPACTTANGCFTKVFARGEAPPTDLGWSLESTLDVQWVHAIAPGAKIVLVEASSNNFGDLFQAIDVALQLGAKYISNSWGGEEFELQTIFDPILQRVGVTEFFGSGDTGAGHFFPASSPDVVAVGGTRLTLNANDVKLKETAWSGSGGGCSLYYAASAVQSSFGQYPRRCAGKRAFPDIAGLADPETGAAFYHSPEVNGGSGWGTVGGTSLSTPIMAARAAITGVAWTPSYIYSSARRYFDVVYGFNGFKAGPGYDLVTGRGRFKS